MLVPVVDGVFGSPNGFGHGQLWIGGGWRDDSQSGAQRPVIEARVEDSGAQSLGRDAVTVGFRDSFDEAVEPQPSQVVGDASRGHLARF